MSRAPRHFCDKCDGPLQNGTCPFCKRCDSLDIKNMNERKVGG